MGKKYRRKSLGFSLVEIMIVVGIVGMLTTMVMPSFLRARRRSTSTAMASDIKRIAGAFEQYAIAHGDYPPDVGPGVVPAGMEQYLPRMDWTAPTPIGGQWDYDGPDSGFSEFRAAVSVYMPTASNTMLQEIDDILDDGNLATGQFVRRANGYAYIIEE